MRIPKGAFHLLDPTKNSPTRIRLFLYSSAFYDGRLVWGTPYTVIPSLWDETTQRVITKKSALKQAFPKADQDTLQRKEKEVVRINDGLSKIGSTVNDFFITRSGSPELSKVGLKSHLDKAFKIRESIPEQKITLNRYIDSFIERIGDGTRRIRKGSKDTLGRRYSKSTVTVYKNFRSVFSEYQEDSRRTYDFSDISMDFYDQLLDYLLVSRSKFKDAPGKSRTVFSENTSGKYVKVLRTILRASAAAGLHSNRSFQEDGFIVLKEEKKPIYLTIEEVKALEEVDLSDAPHLDIYRDLFLAGVYTGQRFSDFSRICSSHIRQTDSGKVIDLSQKKTDTSVVIPVNGKLEQILEKYEFNLPKVSSQKLNAAIKKIAKLAGITAEVKVRERKDPATGSMIIETAPKCDLLSSHAARRTAASAMAAAGIPFRDIMSVTGHKSEKSLRIYIGSNPDETARDLRNYSFFSPTLNTK